MFVIAFVLKVKQPFSNLKNTRDIHFMLFLTNGRLSNLINSYGFRWSEENVVILPCLIEITNGCMARLVKLPILSLEPEFSLQSGFVANDLGGLQKKL